VYEINEKMERIVYTLKEMIRINSLPSYARKGGYII
jgi:hypothetical protein